MQSGATRVRQRESALPGAEPRSGHTPRPAPPGPRFAHDFTRLPVQAKLEVGAPNDPLEEEADRAADCACGGACTSCATKRIQRMSSDAPAEGGRAEARPASSSASADVAHILGGPSHPLDPSARAHLEPRFGHDFSHVRIHDDADSAASADSLGARAYTVGHHLVFGRDEYRPGTADGRRLLAHELAHVMQQSAAGPRIQREDKEKKKKTIPKGPASGSPKLTVKESAKEKAPCACLVFMHHSETNARMAAEAMHELCNYNLAIVAPAGGRNIDINNVGERDPNELFPRHIFRECISDDKPCADFLKTNEKSTDPGRSEEFVQRQFFLAIKQCSKAFTLPIVALHTNVVTDTAAYRAKMKATRKTLATGLAKKDLDEATKKDLEAKKASLERIAGKTFQDEPAPGTPPADTLPYAELEQWLREHMPDLVAERKATAKKEKDRPTWKKKILSPKKGELLSGGMTNIFKWCQAHDNSQCYIGDPDRPDNVVWVTRKDDFARLQGTKANVALQTRVTAGESETDLSSTFVGDLEDDVADRVARDKSFATTPPPVPEGAGPLRRFVHRVKYVLDELSKAEAAERLVIAEREKVRFINIETPQAKADAGERLAGYQDVRTTLQALNLHCCEPDADEQVEERMKK